MLLQCGAASSGMRQPMWAQARVLRVIVLSSFVRWLHAECARCQTPYVLLAGALLHTLTTASLEGKLAQAVAAAEGAAAEAMTPAVRSRVAVGDMT